MYNILLVIHRERAATNLCHFRDQSEKSKRVYRARFFKSRLSERAPGTVVNNCMQRDNVSARNYQAAIGTRESVENACNLQSHNQATIILCDEDLFISGQIIPARCNFRCDLSVSWLSGRTGYRLECVYESILRFLENPSMSLTPVVSYRTGIGAPIEARIETRNRIAVRRNVDR